MTQVPNSRREEFPGGSIGILIAQSANSHFSSQLNAQTGHSIVTIHLPSQDLTENIRREFLILRARCEKVFLISFGEGAISSLAFGEEFGEEVDGLVLIDPVTAPDKRASRTKRKEYKKVFESFDLIENPLLLMYSLGENGEQFSQAQEIAENISSSYIREIVLSDTEESTSIGETILFISEVSHGFWPASLVDDDTELIDAEFESIVAGLSLDQSSPTNFLDSLDLPDPEEHFVEPDPKLLPIQSRAKRNAIYAMIAGPVYAIIAAVTGFNPLGVEPWPGVIAFFGGLATFLYSLRDDFTDEDGAIL